MHRCAWTASAGKNEPARPVRDRGSSAVGGPDETLTAASDAVVRPPRRRVAGLYARLLTVAALVVALDQITKELALSELKRGPVDVIEGVVTLRLTFNSGGAFGLLQGLPGFFLVTSLVVVGVILVLVRRLEDPRSIVPLGMILGGGVGNLADRIFRSFGGRVVDFIDLHVWPVFNLADAAIVVGLGLILLFGGTARARGSLRDPVHR